MSTTDIIYELIYFYFQGKEWRYTTTNEEIEYDGNIYTPIEADVSGVKISDDVFKTELTIKIKNKSPFVGFYIKGSPDALTYVEVYRYRPVTDTASTFFKGEVMSVVVNQKSATVRCNQANIQMTKNLMTNFYQRNCRHNLYDKIGCKLNAADFTIQGEILSLSGNKLIVSNIVSNDENYYVGGQVSIGAESKTISEYNPSTKELTVMNIFAFAEIGDTANVAAGCDHTPETCLAKNNIANYGGESYIPEKNPMEKLDI